MGNTMEIKTGARKELRLWEIEAASQTNEESNKEKIPQTINPLNNTDVDKNVNSRFHLYSIVNKKNNYFKENIYNENLNLKL